MTGLFFMRCLFSQIDTAQAVSSLWSSAKGYFLILQFTRTNLLELIYSLRKDKMHLRPIEQRRDKSQRAENGKRKQEEGERRSKQPRQIQLNLNLEHVAEWDNSIINQSGSPDRSWLLYQVWSSLWTYPPHTVIYTSLVTSLPTTHQTKPVLTFDPIFFLF